MKIKHIFPSLMAIVLLIGCLAGCNSLTDLMDLTGEQRITTLVQGNIDSIYKGIHNPAYLNIVDVTEAEAQMDYLDGLKIEAEYFVKYWGIIDPSLDETYEDLDEDFRNQIITLYQDIYSRSSYTVKDAVAQDDGSYTVQVSIRPIDVMEKAVEVYNSENYQPLNDLWDKYAGVDMSALSQEEYWDYTHEYGKIIVTMVDEQVKTLGYLEEKTQVLQVQEDTDGLLSINSDDWSIFDGYIISYP